MEEDSETLDRLLAEFVARTEVVAAFLLGRDGTVLAQAGDATFIRGDTLAHILREGFSAAEGISGFTDEKQGYLIEPGERDAAFHHLYFSGQATLVSRFTERATLRKVEPEAIRTLEAVMAYFEGELDGVDDDGLLT